MFFRRRMKRIRIWALDSNGETFIYDFDYAYESEKFAKNHGLTIFKTERRF
jgi:hypothetical protein